MDDSAIPVQELRLFNNGVDRAAAEYPDEHVVGEAVGGYVVDGRLLRCPVFPAVRRGDVTAGLLIVQIEPGLSFFIPP